MVGDLITICWGSELISHPNKKKKKIITKIENDIIFLIIGKLSLGRYYHYVKMNIYYYNNCNFNKKGAE